MDAVKDGTEPGRREIWITLGLVAIVVVSMGLLATATGWEETWASLIRLTGWQILFLLLLSSANYLLRGLRWQLYCRVIGLQTSLIQTIRHYIGGFAMTVTPGRMGELVRLRWLRQELGVPMERSAPLMLMDRAADLAATAIVLAIALALSATGIAGGLPVIVLSIGAAVLVTRKGLALWALDRAYAVIGRWERLFVRARRAARTLGPFSRWDVLLPAMLLGGFGWLAEGYAFHLLLVWMGSDIGVWTAVAIFLISMVTGGATGAPGGLGGAEAAMVALLSLQGVPLEVSIPATAIIRITTLWFALGLGVIVFPMATRQAMKGQHARQT